MITTLDQLIDAMANASESIVISKASIATQAAGGFSSLWRATGTPGQGAIPGAAAVCTKSLLGALKDFANAGGGESVYLGRLFLLSGNSATDVQLHDRLAHMGGLSGTVTAAQTVNLSVASLIGSRCNADCQSVQWWIEQYTDIGTTAVSATVTYTDANDVGSKTVSVGIGGASPLNQDSRMFLIPDPADGVAIKSIQTIQHATTGTAGNYGITATKAIGGLSLGLANNGSVADWASLGLPRVPNDACIFPIMICGTTSTGTLYGNAKLITG